MTLSWPLVLGFLVGLVLAKVGMLALEDWLKSR